MRICLLAGSLSLLMAAPAWAQSTVVPALASSAASVPASVTNLQVISVTGVQPGPGLWKVSKGGHVMWVLGTVSPLPKHMQWQSRDVEDAIAQSQEVLDSPSVDLKADTGFFGKLFLLPSLYSARKNPDGATLQQVLPPPLYTRWLVLKQQYIGNDSGIEHWRPLLAALKLYRSALDKDGLAFGGEVNDTVRKLAKKHDVKTSKVQYQMVIEQPRQAVQQIEHSSLHDLSCFNQTMDVVQHDMSALTQRANAWSTGDTETLQKLSLTDRYQSCVTAVTTAAFSQQLGLRDLPQHIEDTWLAAAESALSRNRQTFAVLPMEQVLTPNGFLAKLKARGYIVQSPDEQDQ